MEKTFELPYPTKAMQTYSRALLSNKRKPAIEATINTTLTTKNFFGAQWARINEPVRQPTVRKIK